MSTLKRKSEDKKPLWKKVTRGTWVLRNPYERLLYKGKVRIEVERILPKIDEFELLENGTGKYKVDIDQLKKGEKTAVNVSAPEPDEDEYSLKKKKGGWYDVVSASGEQMNDKSLKKEEAQELLDQLNGEG